MDFHYSIISASIGELFSGFNLGNNAENFATKPSFIDKNMDNQEILIIAIKIYIILEKSYAEVDSPVLSN